MLMTTFKTVQDALAEELRESLDHAETMGIITADESVTFGIKWLNPKPEKEPLDCPFCGTDEIFYHEVFSRPSFGELPDFVNIGCGDCGITIQAETKEEAITAWNKRANPTFFWKITKSHKPEEKK